MKKENPIEQKMEENPIEQKMEENPIKQKMSMCSVSDLLQKNGFARRMFDNKIKKHPILSKHYKVVKLKQEGKKGRISHMTIDKYFLPIVMMWMDNQTEYAEEVCKVMCQVESNKVNIPGFRV